MQSYSVFFLKLRKGSRGYEKDRKTRALPELGSKHVTGIRGHVRRSPRI
jgi:hypothetical protein